MSWFRPSRKWFLLGIVIAGSLLLWEGYYAWRESSQDPFILAAAERYGVHPALLKAVVWQESRFNPTARGSKGEIGLMQLMPDTAKEWAQAEKSEYFGEGAMLNPELNIQAGAWYLRKLSRRYLNTDNPLIYTLADYNAGRSKVLRWAKDAGTTNSAVFVEQIGFPSTKHYVNSVTQRFQHYKKRFPPEQIHQGTQSRQPK